MKFFLPLNVHSADEAESDLKSIAEFVHGSIPEPRGFKLEHRHYGKEMVGKVGESIDPYYG